MHSQAASKALESSKTKASLKAAFTELMTADSTTVGPCIIGRCCCRCMPCSYKTGSAANACSQNRGHWVGVVPACHLLLCYLDNSYWESLEPASTLQQPMARLRTGCTGHVELAF